MEEYVSTKSELTGKLREYTAAGYECYHVRTTCGCKKRPNNTEMYLSTCRRNAVMVTSDEHVIK